MRLRKRSGGRRTRIPAPHSIPVIEPGGRLRATPSEPSRGRRKRASGGAPRWNWTAFLRKLDTVLAYAVLTTLSASLWFSPRTQLQTLQITGVPEPARATVQAQLASCLQTPIPLSDLPRRAERTLQQMGWVADATWRPQTPHQAQLRVQPREPFIEVRYPNGEKRYLDPTGFLFHAPKPPAMVSGGVIRTTTPAEPPADGEMKHPAMRRAFEVLKAVHEAGRTRQARILIAESGELLLYCQPHAHDFELTFRLGDAAPLNEQIPLICQILAHADTQMARWEYVDIKSPAAPAIKLTGGEVHE